MFVQVSQSHGLPKSPLLLRELLIVSVITLVGASLTIGTQPRLHLSVTMEEFGRSRKSLPALGADSNRGRFRVVRRLLGTFVSTWAQASQPFP